MYDYRLATMEDFETVYEFAKAFYNESPYSNTHEFSEARVKEVIRIYLASPTTEACTVLLTKDEVPVGLIVCVTSKSLFSDGVYAVEHIWWVDPAHRGKGKAALGLIVFFEKWAESIGATDCIVASVNGVTDVSRIYSRLGYTEYERSYLKRIKS